MARRKYVFFVGAMLLLVKSGVVTLPPASAVFVQPTFDEASFKFDCEFSHSNKDDPIVYPRLPAVAHRHDFFGNTSTDAYSTLPSLRAAGTTCTDLADKAAYWTPSVYKNGTKVVPTRLAAYYVLGGKRPGTIKTIPQGLKMIAGDSKATAPQGLKATTWACVDGGPVSFKRSNEVPYCPVGSQLVLAVRFPDCWDGIRLDSPDHKSHMSQNLYTGGCPTTHPVPIPELVIVVRYQSLGGSGITLSSGGRYSGHADFINTWDPTRLAALVQRCLNGVEKCR